jgi:hypothetical protein
VSVSVPWWYRYRYRYRYPVSMLVSEPVSFAVSVAVPMTVTITVLVAGPSCLDGRELLLRLLADRQFDMAAVADTTRLPRS